jgi:hypothetical protein
VQLPSAQRVDEHLTGSRDVRVERERHELHGAVVVHVLAAHDDVVCVADLQRGLGDVTGTLEHNNTSHQQQQSTVNNPPPTVVNNGNQQRQRGPVTA